MISNQNYKQNMFGVHQGSLRGPLLFLMFMNDLPLYTENVFTDLFADDTTIHQISNSQHFIEQNVQAALEIVSEYEQEIPQSQTADNPMAPRGRAAQPSRDTRKTN